MRRATGAGAEHLRAEGEIQASHAILVESDAGEAKKSSDDGTERGVEKRARPLGKIAAMKLALVNLDGNVEWPQTLVG
jgi:hypothetical protein